MFNYSLNMGSLMGTLWGLTHFWVDASSGHSRNCRVFFLFLVFQPWFCLIFPSAWTIIKTTPKPTFALQVSGTVQSVILCDTASPSPRRTWRAKCSCLSSRVRSTSWDESHPSPCTTRS